MTIRTLQRRTIHCVVTVFPETMESELRWQPHAIAFWRLLHEQAPNVLLRREYALQVLTETTRLEALHRLNVTVSQLASVPPVTATAEEVAN